MWGYKILFLDVLFPLDVPRIIFLDADLVLRADVAELWEMDLQGKAYGYTPMGNSSRRRDCHSAAAPSAFSRCINSDGEGASAQ